MLGKLIKHELKAQYKSFLVLYIAAAFLNIVLKIYHSFTQNLQGIKLANIFEVTLNMLVIFVSIALFIATFVVSIRRFYNSMMKDEGYLTNTLPVPTWMLILSKYLVFILWMLVGVIFHFFVISLHSGSLTWINDFANGFFEGMLKTIEEPGITIVEAKQFFILLFISIALSALFFMTQVYFSFSIGQLSNKNKLGVSVAVFFGIIIVLQIISMFLSTFILPDNYVTMKDADAILMSIKGIKLGLVYDSIISVAFYIGANVLFTKKLNLE